MTGNDSKADGRHLLQLKVTRMLEGSLYAVSTMHDRAEETKQ